jgi:hypothetical protein
MTKAAKIIDEMKLNGYEYVYMTTVWNYHNTKLENSRNIKKAIRKIKERDIEADLVIKVGAIGRTQHSSTEILIFKKSKVIDLN